MGKDKIKIILILALALVLRLINLNQSFWLDEGAQVLMSQKSLTFLWFGREGDFQPPLFYFLTHFWLQLGEDEWFLRLPSVVFGVLTVYLIFVLGKRLFGRKAGLLSALFLTASPYHIYYSQEARMYSLLVFLAVASTVFLLEENWIWYVLTNTAILYTHYASIFFILSQIVWVFLWQKELLEKFIKSLIFPFLFFLPWLPQFLKQLQGGQYLVNVLPKWREISNISTIKVLPLTLIKFSLGRVSFENKIFYTGIAVFIFAVLGFIFYQALKECSKEKIFLANWFLTPIIVCAVVSFFIPMYQPFRLLFTIIPFYLLLALGVLSTNKKYQITAMGIALSISFSGLFLYYTNPKFQRENWREAARFIESQDPRKSVVIFEFSEPFAPYQWYARGKVKAQGVLPGLKATQDLVNQKMPEVTREAENVFLFQYLQSLTDPNRLVEKWLKENGFEEKEIKDFSGVGFVYNYSKVK